MKTLFKFIGFTTIAALLLNRYAGIQFTLPSLEWEDTDRLPGYVRQIKDLPSLVRPEGIPVVNCSGDTIKWTWKKQHAWNDGRLFFHRDEEREDCVEFVIIKLKETPAFMKEEQPDVLLTLNESDDE